MLVKDYLLQHEPRLGVLPRLCKLQRHAHVTRCIHCIEYWTTSWSGDGPTIGRYLIRAHEVNGDCVCVRGTVSASLDGTFSKAYESQFIMQWIFFKFEAALGLSHWDDASDWVVPPDEHAELAQ